MTKHQQNIYLYTVYIYIDPRFPNPKAKFTSTATADLGDSSPILVFTAKQVSTASAYIHVCVVDLKIDLHNSSQREQK